MEVARFGGSMPRSGGEQMKPVMAAIREMEVARDLDGLATVALVALARLRLLCERPTTCAELDSMIATLETLKPHLKMPEE
jgi:hypothetical protein